MSEEDKVMATISRTKAVPFENQKDIPSLIFLFIVIVAMDGSDLPEKLNNDDKAQKIPLTSISAMQMQSSRSIGQ